MKCQILFSGKIRIKGINLSSAELAQRVIKVKFLFGYFIHIQLFHSFRCSEYVNHEYKVHVVCYVVAYVTKR